MLNDEGLGGTRRIQMAWRDRAALMVLRSNDKPPPAVDLPDSFGAEYSNETFFLMEAT